MPHKYKFRVNGIMANGVAWSSTGEVECSFPDLFTTVVERTFDDLTNGRAVFGQPGVGCRGPYDISEIHMERLPWNKTLASRA